MSADAVSYERELLVPDERGRAFPAVLRYGPYLFISGSDGERRASDEVLDPALAENAIEQCRNSYGRIKQRLNRAGYGDDCVVWVENFTSGQHWRLERMALWPEYFGEDNHLRAVSFGVQTRMHGLNMLTTIAMAVDPSVPRTIAVPAPHRGRASRCTRVGPFTFVIGVRGHIDTYTKAHAPEETPDAFGLQFEYSLNALRSHLEHDGNTLDSIVRLDCGLRAARFVQDYEDELRARFGGRIPFASYAIGVPLGGTCEQEIGGIAVAPGEPKTVVWSSADPTLADSVSAAGLVFARNVSGIRDERAHHVRAELAGDVQAQVRNAIFNLEHLLAEARTSTKRLLRLDVFLRDIYGADEVLGELTAILGDDMPVLTFLGAEPQHGAEIELTAIAGAA
jgi:enamine deaminase RidA (YjgF/YER057c/UK114 family)